MNGCEYYQELISRLIDSELSEDEHTVLMGHLRRCDDCATVYKAFYSVSHRLADQLEQAPEELSANVMAHIRRNEIKRKNHAPLKKILASAACLAVILAAAGSILPKISQRSADVVLSSTATADEANVATAVPETATVSPEGRAVNEPDEAPATTAPPAVDETATENVATAAAPTQAPAETSNGYTQSYGSQSNSSVLAPAPATNESSSGGYSASEPDTEEFVVSSSTASGNTLLGAAPPAKVEIDTQRNWSKLTTLLSGKESKFDPLASDSDEAESVYILVLLPDEKMEMKVYLYEKELYYTVFDKTAQPGSTPTPQGTPARLKYMQAKCSVEDFLKFVDTFPVK